jgi:uncharacterized protein (DUF305 family)
MKTSLPRPIVAALPAIVVSLSVVLTACGGAARSANSNLGPQTTSPTGRSPAAIAAADSGRPPYTRADVDFISGMIGHHAQAVLMAGWAKSHGASASLQGLAERIVVAQQDEIVFMQRWLRERREQVPSADPSHMMMAGMDMKLMPGMLTPEQLIALDKARGSDFDRLFLQDMIQHHNGALSMVATLFDSHGAGQDEDVFKFAVDVHADQTTEINRMTLMLQSVPSSR